MAWQSNNKWYKIGSTTSSTDARDYYSYYVNDSTGNPFVSREEDPIKKAVKEKEKEVIERMRHEFKQHLTQEVKKVAEKEAKQLIKDIDTLKEEKSRLGKRISALREQLKQTKKELREEAESIEKMMEEKAREILRFQQMEI